MADIRTVITGQKRFFESGKMRESDFYLAPTILDNVRWDDPIMQEEIFGPLMPVLEFSDLEEIISMVKEREKPLALYLFSSDKKAQKRFFNEIQCGGGCINDTLTHFIGPYLPVGGVGSSGIGNYHGRAGFNAFSHQKSVYQRPLFVDIPLRYPPYRKKHLVLRNIFGR
jgi:aldehyde dehydrogenase (NAD+)